jgi:hypothetical protein
MTPFIQVSATPAGASLLEKAHASRCDKRTSSMYMVVVAKPEDTAMAYHAQYELQLVHDDGGHV